MNLSLRLTVIALLLAVSNLSATTRYVWQGSPGPAPPYTTWASAAHVIQDAVDTAQTGDTVLVAGGVYATGGRAVGTNLLVNRVAIDRAITVESLMGPEVTSIVGTGPTGSNAVRCVYLTNGAVLAGFTLTNGATHYDGDYYADRSGGGVWCESSSAVVSNCVLTGNSAYNSGGGAYSGTLSNCTLTGNSAGWGGGADLATLNNCTLTANSAWLGGGAAGGTLYNCTLTGNSADYGGGALSSTLNNCTLTGNSADYGGGAAGDVVFFGDCTLNNCIVYYNTAPRGGNYYNYYECELDYCCTTPLPAGGTGNTDAEPQLASASHLSANSPCLGRGSGAYASGLDIDGEPWANPPAIGCDQYWSGSVTGAISVAIAVSYTNVAVGFAVDFQALIGGRLSASRWDFGDAVVVSNRPWASHAWGAPGEYVVELRAYSESYPAGITASVTVQVAENPVHYVALASANPVPPYSSWASAATNIQDAVDAAVPGALVRVTNGVYQTGARAVYGMSNRVAVTKPVTVRSVNGPVVTSIVGTGPTGSNAVRCVYLTNGALLAGFTLTNGATQTSGDYYADQSGGGVWCESPSAVVSNCVLAGNAASSDGGGASDCTLNNCTLTGNSATNSGGGAAWSTLNNCTLTGNSASSGGGAADGTLNNCTLSGNSASYYGGGAAYGTLNNCTLTGNSTTGTDGVGGGAYSGTLNNCIVYYNTAPNGENYDEYDSKLDYCCTTPMPTNGVGNLTAAPLFVDTNGWSNLRLQTSSPCINAGNNGYAPGLTDLDGRPRIVGGTVDVGAYEFQGPGMSEFIGWLWHCGLPTDGSADYLDTDSDGHNNWQEWRCRTDPTNPLSALRLLSASRAGPNVTVTWQSVAGVTYFLQRSTNLSASPPFILLAPNLPGQPDTTTYTDTNAASLAPLFYRVGVQ